MGEEWMICCEIHCESLFAGKSPELGSLRGRFQQSPSEAFRELCQVSTQISTRWRPSRLPQGPPDNLELQETERWLSLIGAFVARHRACVLRLVSDDSTELDSQKMIVRDWTAFAWFQDRPLWELQDRLMMRNMSAVRGIQDVVPIDPERRRAEQKAEIERFRRELANTRSWARRRKVKRQLQERIDQRERSEVSSESMKEFLDSQFDVLERIRNLPPPTEPGAQG